MNQLSAFQTEGIPFLGVIRFFFCRIFNGAYQINSLPVVQRLLPYVRRHAARFLLVVIISLHHCRDAVWESQEAFFAGNLLVKDFGAFTLFRPVSFPSVIGHP